MAFIGRGKKKETKAMAAARAKEEAAREAATRQVVDQALHNVQALVAGEEPHGMALVVLAKGKVYLSHYGPSGGVVSALEQGANHIRARALAEHRVALASPKPEATPRPSPPEPRS